MTGIHPGVLMALGSAALFGASTPFAKLLLGAADPWMLAAVLYLGSGIGLSLFRLVSGARTGEAPLAARDWPWFGAAILAGGVAGPILLMLGLTATPAASAALLLNVESVATALIAWLVFRENCDRRIVAGMAVIVAGAVVLSWQGAASFGGAAGPLLVIGACIAWAVDNNLTRKVALSDPVQIAALKGLVAGAVNLALALARGADLPPPHVALLGGAVGLLGYGISIALFVAALRRLGTARTGAYFGTAPFLGAVIAVGLLGEPLTPALLVAGVLMAIGVALHLAERHDHEHAHTGETHEHRHSHDVHHQHAHGPGVPPGEPHSHAHVHAPSRHRHPHFPDAHHQHGHGT